MRFPWSPAVRANSRGNAADEAGRHAEAETHYLAAIRLDPSWSEPCFNLGLLYKNQGRWQGSLDLNLRACALSPEGAEPCWWNLGIAATALQDWSTARRAWRAFGLAVPDGDGPIAMELADVPIRLKPDSEVVWCARLDPARACIMNIPMLGTAHRYQDILLHDGAATGHRMRDGVQIPVFDELTVLEASTYITHAIAVHCPGPADGEELRLIVADAGGAFEDWTRSVVPLCALCSAGTPHEHDGLPDLPWQPERRCAIAVQPGSDVQALLTRWIAGDSSRQARIQV